MRLFAAIALPAEARAALRQAVAPWRAEPWPVRWVDAESYHVTLQFFGEAPPAVVPALSQALAAAAAGTPPLDLCLTGFGVFPGPGRARVLWADLAAPPALELLQHRLVSATAPLGFADERLRFQPHVTLGRVRANHRLGRAAVDRLLAQPMEHPFVAEEVALFQSRPAPGGARYHVLHREGLHG